MSEVALSPSEFPTFQTKRATSAALEERLYVQRMVLGNSSIRLVDYLGTEDSIVRAARVSYGLGTKSTSDDAGLIDYLIRQLHSSPIEQVQITWHMTLPIFIARQFIRTRTARVNEMSARYSILPADFYIPTPEDCAPQSKTNKQGRAIEGMSKEQSQAVIDLLTYHSQVSYDNYETLLNEPGQIHKFPDINNHDKPGENILLDDDDYPGLARELSRMSLTLNTLTSWYFSLDGNNLLKTLNLRLNLHAQKEIRVFANEMAEDLKVWLPNVYKSFENASLRGGNITHKQLQVIKELLLQYSESGNVPMSKNDIISMCAKDSEVDIGKRELQELINLIEQA